MAAASNVLELNLAKLNLFKTQDPQTGRFDLTFEIGGKLLYAHKCMLNLVSDTLDSMISERWTSKNDLIKIEDYNFDEFYQFLTFLYSGECLLTTENIHSMVDIAEFYQVQCFKKYCDSYMSTTELNVTNVFTFLKLAMKYSLTELLNSAKQYASKNFANISVADDFFLLNKLSMEEIVIASKESVTQEDLFQAVFKWAEKQALLKKEKSEDANYNLNDAIKAEISRFLPHVEFTEMKISFLHEFVVPRGFIFDSFDELSKILCGACFKKKVVVTNANGQKLSGKISPDNKTLIEKIESFKLSNQYSHDYCWWNPKAEFPSKPSPLKKRSGVDWYLIYFSDGAIGIARDIQDSDYLIAEMFPETGNDFVVTPNCKIQIDRNY